MDAAEVETAALVGMFDGGAIALLAALSIPERVSALVLVAAALDGFDGTDEQERDWEERMGPVEALVLAGELEKAQDVRLLTWAPLGTGRSGRLAHPRDRHGQPSRADHGRGRRRGTEACRDRKARRGSPALPS